MQLQCCIQSSLERESDRVQAEHDTRPAFLALDFLARLRSTVQYMRRQLHWCALHHPVRLQHRHVFWCQTAQERHPHMHVRGTESLLDVCALCFGLALDCASEFVVAYAIASDTLSEPGTRYVFNTVISQFCRVDQRQCCQYVHQAPSDVSVASPFCHRLSHRSTALPRDQKQASQLASTLHTFVPQYPDGEVCKLTEMTRAPCKNRLEARGDRAHRPQNYGDAFFGGS